MRKFTEEDYKSLIPFEDKMKSAINSKYVTGMTTEGKDIIHTVYKEVFGRQANLSCPGCVLQMLTTVGKFYFDYKQNKESEEAYARKKSKGKGNEQTKLSQPSN